MKILIDNGHGINTKGKQSPDGRLREYRFTRSVARRVVAELKRRGHDAELVTPEDADIRLGERCNRINAWSDRLGRDKVLAVSIHVNAAGSGVEWMRARGWEAWTSKGETKSDVLAEYLYDTAAEYLPVGTSIRTDRTDGDRDKEENFTILYRTKCAAVLTENLFQDNREDCDYLLSEEGESVIVKLHVEGIENYIKSQRER